jgi:protein arginine N-methyltransferase 3
MPSFSTLDAGQEHSLLAANSGAKHVYALDASDIAEKAGQIVRTNGLENVIT